MTKGKRSHTTNNKKKKARRRKSATWTHVTPEQLKDFQAKHKLTERATAEALGVSYTSFHKWTQKDLVAMTVKQKLVKRRMASYGKKQTDLKKNRAKRRSVNQNDRNGTEPVIDLLETALAQNGDPYVKAALVLLKAAK